MDRIFMHELKAWKNAIPRKPLIVRGARQVGKTYIIQEFGKTFSSGGIHTVNLERHPEWHSLFNQNFDPVRIIRELEILLNTTISPGSDLLFFDEIQSCPKAISALRYFYEEIPELHVIAASSLLEFALKEVRFPVGRVNLLELTPLNFIEFLRATGKKNLADIVADKPAKHSDAIHQLLLAQLKIFMFVGGMPECVKVWQNTQSLSRVLTIQSDLINTFRQDFSQYSPLVDSRSLNYTLDHLSKHNGHQVIYARLSEEFSGPTNKKAFDLLTTARLVHKVRSTSPAGLPLAVNASEKRFKAVFLDMGLLHSLNGVQVKLEFLKNELLSVYEGGLAEQYAGQEFISAGHNPLFYWAREAKSSNAEVDYLIVKEGKICPFEIKTGKSGSLRSMHLLLEQYPEIENGYVLSSAPYGTIPEKRIIFLPLYYAYSFLANRQ